MAVQQIVLYPDPRLSEPCRPAKLDEVDAVAQDLRDTLAGIEHGAGLAAPQIGHMVKVALVQTETLDLVLVNPQLLRSEGEQKTKEGCLSIPGVFGQVKRPERIKISSGFDDEVELEGWDAVVTLHEMDHLNGVLFLDHLGKVERRLVLKRYRKLKRRRRSV